MTTEDPQTPDRAQDELRTPYVDGFVIAVAKDRIDEYEETRERPPPCGGSTARSA